MSDELYPLNAIIPKSDDQLVVLDGEEYATEAIILEEIMRLKKSGSVLEK